MENVASPFWRCNILQKCLQLFPKKTCKKQIARIAMRKNTGARGLRAIMESVMEDIMFDLPDEKNVTKCIITRAAVLGEDQPVYVFRGHDFRSA